MRAINQQWFEWRAYRERSCALAQRRCTRRAVQKFLPVCVSSEHQPSATDLIVMPHGLTEVIAEPKTKEHQRPAGQLYLCAMVKSEPLLTLLSSIATACVLKARLLSSNCSHLEIPS